MYDCAKDVLAHHDDEVTLPQSERTEMRDRRNSNRDRLRKGLKANDKPMPLEFKSQGSYAMKTMVQDDGLDYDIDDGIYFEKKDLVGPRGAEMTALQARWMVRDAIDDGSFAEPPEVRNNCVRVYYKAGYHVDLPVYRRVTVKDFLGTEIVYFELASSDWKRSDARDVTIWFEGQNNQQSPDASNGRQLRRTTRQLKAFARSRTSWKGRVFSGFGITKLVTEHYVANAEREDRALYDTMKAIRDRLNWKLVVDHPCTPGDTISKGQDDPKVRMLREKLSEAIDNLAPLFDAACTRETALKCWDKVFNTTFFSDRATQKSALSAPAILTSGLVRAAAEQAHAQSAVRKEGGGRYA
jgi:hypothetical protein